MKQTTFASLEYAGKKHQTRREKFRGEMDRVVPSELAGRLACDAGENAALGALTTLAMACDATNA